MFEEESELEKCLRGIVKQQDRQIAELVKREFGIDAYDKFGRVDQDALQMLSNFYRLKKESSPLFVDSQSPYSSVATIDISYELEPVRDNFFVVVGNCVFDEYDVDKAVFFIDDNPSVIEELECHGRTFEDASRIARDIGG